MYAAATLQKLYGEEVQKLNNSTVPLTELPGAVTVVEQLKNNPNPTVRKSAIEALSYIQTPAYAKDLETIFSIAQKDQDENVQKAATEALDKAQKIVGDTPIAIDYTLTMRPLGLARLLLEHGFNVESIYVDSFIAEEQEDFNWLKENYPDIKIYATVHVKMRFVDRKSDDKILALGQKAAYFTGSNNFVNIVEGGGMYGFDGIVKLADLMIDAFLNEKDAKKLIQFKGLGCENYETNCK